MDENPIEECDGCELMTEKPKLFFAAGPAISSSRGEKRAGVSGRFPGGGKVTTLSLISPPACGGGGGAERSGCIGLKLKKGVGLRFAACSLCAANPWTPGPAVLELGWESGGVSTLMGDEKSLFVGV